MFEIFFRSRILLNKKREADASLFPAQLNAAYSFSLTLAPLPTRLRR